MIVARMQGGLGNQMFIYAAARGIAAKHGLALKFDTMSGSKRDTYGRGEMLLHHFNTRIEAVGHHESFEDRLGRSRRFLVRNICRWLPFQYRVYVEEAHETKHFDERLFSSRPTRDIYLHGYWQSEKYFKHIENDIRKELDFVTPHDAQNVLLSQKIRSTNAVCVHARRLHGVGNIVNPKPLPGIQSLGLAYYQKSISYVIERVENPVFFFFSDYPQWLQDHLRVPYPAEYVTHNTVPGEAKNYEDLWLMTQCRHFVIADSSFSWWGAWLSVHPDKIVCAPTAGLRFNQDWIPKDWRAIESS